MSRLGTSTASRVLDSDGNVLDFPQHTQHDRKTLHSGVVYDIDSTELAVPSNATCAAKVREELGDFVVTDLSDRPVYRRLKRVFDVVFSGAVLVCFSWLYLLIALLVKIDDPKGPVFFKQRRAGMNGVEFDMLKFRSMCVDAESRLVELQELNEKTGPVFKIKEDPRITRVGKWLRKLSLDELPQFINVFAGDIPLRILKMRPDFSMNYWGAFALPANEERTEFAVFPQVKTTCGCGLRNLRISSRYCNAVDMCRGQFFAKRDFRAVVA